MRAEGFVKSVSGDLCEVVVGRRAACGENCVACGGNCTQKNSICVAKNTLDASPGDRVVVEMDSRVVLLSAFLVYIVPLIVFIVTFCLLDEVSQLTATIGSVGVSGVFYVFLHWYDKRRKGEYISRVVEII